MLLVDRVGEAAMLDYIFSPRAMLVDAVVGIVMFVIFRLLGARLPPSKLELAAIGMIAFAASYWYVGPPPGMRGISGPRGFVDRMVDSCSAQASAQACECAVDRLREQAGEAGLARVAFRAHVNLVLPKEFTQVLSACGG
jgi:hypothetical protein